MNILKIFLIGLLAPLSLCAQNVLKVNAVDFPPLVEYDFVSGANYDIQVTLFYESGDAVLTEDVTIMFQTDKMVQESQPPEEFIPEQIVNIPLGGYQVLIADNFPFQPSDFRVGGNIVVIWPSFSDPAVDSLQTTVEVSDTLSTGEEKVLETQLLQALKSGQLNAQWLNDQGIRGCQLIGIDGKAIRLDDWNSKGHPNGYYLFVYPGNNQKLHVIKWLHTAQ
jgi:hypothetical protein